MFWHQHPVLVFFMTSKICIKLGFEKYCMIDLLLQYILSLFTCSEICVVNCMVKFPVVQIGGSGVLISPLTYIFDEETPRWRQLLSVLGL